MHTDVDGSIKELSGLNLLCQAEDVVSISHLE